MLPDSSKSLSDILGAVQAFSWYLKAAKQGDAMAAYVIGTMYNYGRGVQQDKSQADIWLNKACGNGVEMSCDQ